MGRRRGPATVSETEADLAQEGFQPGRIPLRYAPRQGSQPITFEKGMDESQEASSLPPGLSPKLVNWRPEPTGGLRSRRRFASSPTVFDGAAAPAAKSVRGMAYLSGVVDPGTTNWPSHAVWVVAMKNDTNGVDVWGADTSLGGHWKYIDTVQGLLASEADVAPVVFAKGYSSILYTHPQLTLVVGTDGIRRWAGDYPPTISSIFKAPRSRALCFAKQRFWAGGCDIGDANFQPYRLYYSNLNTYTGWAGLGDPPDNNNNYLDIGKDDGLPIEDIVSFQNNLLVAKRSSVFAISGSGPDTFQVTELAFPAGGGRCLIPTPKGVIVLAEDEVFLWNGGDANLISKGIQDSYHAGAPDWRTGVYVDGVVYVTQHAANAPMLAFDTEQGAWWIEEIDFSSGSNDRPVCAAAWNNRLAVGPDSSTAGPPMVYKDDPGGTRTADGFAANEHFEAWTPRQFVGTISKVTVRAVYVRLRQRGDLIAGQTRGVTMTPYADGTPVTPSNLNLPGTDGQVLEYRISTGFTCFSFQIQFTYDTSNVAGVGPPYAPLFDIESVVPIYDVIAPE